MHTRTLPNLDLQAIDTRIRQACDAKEPIALARQNGVPCRSAVLPAGVESTVFRGVIIYRDGPGSPRAILVALASVLLRRAELPYSAGDAHALAELLRR